MSFWDSLTGRNKPKSPANSPLASKNYYLGVSSTEAAFDAIDELSFCRVLNRTTGQIQIIGVDRIKVVVGPADPDDATERTQDTLVWLGGKFTPNEMLEIERLAAHSNPRALLKVVDFVARISAQAKGIHQILGPSA